MVLERIVPAGAECLGADFEVGGALGAFVFVAGNHAGDFADGFFRVPFGCNGFGGEVVLEVEFQDGVELGIVRQGVLVFLPRMQFG